MKSPPKKHFYPNPKTLEDLQDGKGGISEFGWNWLRTLAFGIRVKYWRDYPNVDDLEQEGVLKGALLVKNDRHIEVRHPRNFIMKGMRNSMRNFIYHAHEWKRRSSDENGERNSVDDASMNMTESMDTSEFDVSYVQGCVDGFIRSMEGFDDDMDRYRGPLLSMSKKICNHGFHPFTEEMSVPLDVDQKTFNRIVVLFYMYVRSKFVL